MSYLGLSIVDAYNKDKEKAVLVAKAKLAERLNVGIEKIALKKCVMLSDTENGKPPHQRLAYYPDGLGWPQRWHVRVERIFSDEELGHAKRKD